MTQHKRDTIMYRSGNLRATFYKYLYGSIHSVIVLLQDIFKTLIMKVPHKLPRDNSINK